MTYDDRQRLDAFVAAVESRTGGQAKRRGGYTDLRCPSHEDRSPSLTAWLDGKGTVAVLCRAGCSRDAILAAVGWTWKDAVRPLTDEDKRRHAAGRVAVAPRTAPPPPAEPKAPAEDWAELTHRYVHALPAWRLAELAAQLGVSQESLVRLRCGWEPAWRMYTFPMYGSDGMIVGIRTRDPRTGKKMSVTGSVNGLFLPREFTWSQPRVVCEGPTSLAALLDLGFSGIGIPSALGRLDWAVEYFREWSGQTVVIVADVEASGAGLKSANKLAQMLVLVVPEVRIIVPPNGIKDVRDWRKVGATRDDLDAAIAAAPANRLAVNVRGIGGRS